MGPASPLVPRVLPANAGGGRADPLRRRFLRLAWAVPLAGTLPMVMVLAFPALFRGKDVELALVAGGTFLLGWMAMHLARGDKQLDVFEPVVLIFALQAIFFPIRTLLGIALDDRLLYNSRDATMVALFASLLGFAFFAVGCRVRVGASLTRMAERFRGEWNLRRASLFAFVLLGLSAASWAALWFLTGSVYSLLLIGPASKFRWDQFPAWYFYLLWGTLLVQAGAIFQLVLWLRYRRQPVITLLFCAMGLLASFLISRLAVSIFLMLVLLLFHYLRRRLSYRLLALASLVLMVYLSIAGMARSTLSLQYSNEMTGWSMVRSRAGWADLARIYLVQGFDNFWWLGSILERVPADMPHQYGATFLPALAKPIPRALWPQKPLGAAAVYSRELFPDLLDQGFVAGVTALGEWYLNFSWPGIVVGMFLMGVLASASHSLVRRTPGPGSVLLYGALLVGLVLWYRNEFNIGVTWFLYYLIPFVIGLWLVVPPPGRLLTRR